MTATSERAPASRLERPLSIFVVHPSHFLTDTEANGDGLIAHGFIRELARRGHHLDVAYEWSNLREPMPPNVTMHRIACRLPIDPLRRIEYMVRVRLLLRRVRRQRRIDVAHQLNPVFTGLSLGLAGSRVPIVLGTFVARWPDETRGGLPKRLRKAVLDVVSRLQQRGAAALLVTTRAALRDRIARAPRIRSRVRFLQHGVDTTAFSPAPAPRGGPFGRFVLVAGLLPRKGVLVLLEAFGRAIARFPEARLCFVGGGGAIERLRARSAELGIAHAVEFLDDVPRARVPEILRASDVLCLPSYGEPYGTSVTEAMACGLPVIVSDTGGVPELVDAEGALTVATGSVDALAAALGALLADPERARAMGRHNRERALAIYDWSAVGDALEAAYADVLASRVSAGRSRSR